MKIFKRTPYDPAAPMISRFLDADSQIPVEMQDYKKLWNTKLFGDHMITRGVLHQTDYYIPSYDINNNFDLMLLSNSLAVQYFAKYTRESETGHPISKKETRIWYTNEGEIYTIVTKTKFYTEMSKIQASRRRKKNVITNLRTELAAEQDILIEADLFFSVHVEKVRDFIDMSSNTDLFNEIATNTTDTWLNNLLPLYPFTDIREALLWNLQSADGTEGQI